MAEINFPLRVVAKGSTLVTAFSSAVASPLPAQPAGEAWVIMVGGVLAHLDVGQGVTNTNDGTQMSYYFYNDGSGFWAIRFVNDAGADVTFDWVVLGCLAT